MEGKMKKEQLKKFKKLLEEQKSNILFNDKVIREDFNLSQDDRYDEVDQASAELDQGMRMRFRNRERFLIKKIDEALARIEDGTFGECESCGCEIGINRLLARPTATLCVECKEEQERIENSSVDGRRPKSLGVSIAGR
jgi:DnaK suppressor protein